MRAAVRARIQIRAWRLTAHAPFRAAPPMAVIAKADTAKRAGAAWPPPPTIDIGPSGHGTSLAVEMLASLANVIDCQSPKADNQLFSTSSRPLPAAPSRLGNFGA